VSEVCQAYTRACNALNVSSAPPSSAVDELRAKLAGRARERFGGEVEIAGLRPLRGGSSRELWAFELLGAGRARPMVLRADPRGLADPAGRRREFAALAAAHRHGAPVPEPFFMVSDLGPDGEAGLVIERLPGEASPRRLLTEDRFAGTRAAMTTDIARAAAAIHAVPLDEVPEIPESSEHRALEAVEELERELDRIGEPHPAIELGLRWMRRNLPPPAEPVLVHGDLRTGNLIADERGLVGVLDWELVHAGDPAEDLGWLCIRSWRFGHDELPAGGFGTREELLAAYRVASSQAVDEEALRFWEAYGNARWGVICLAQAEVHRSGRVRSLDRAAIGRRAAEAEWDLLELIG
jgi:aminoglycoside phosphotransferase (APT) family kinase protein